MLLQFTAVVVVEVNVVIEGLAAMKMNWKKTVPGRSGRVLQSQFGVRPPAQERID